MRVDIKQVEKGRINMAEKDIHETIPEGLQRTICLGVNERTPN